MKIQIAIQDREEAEKFERMNMSDKTPVEWADFYFKASMLESMWHDPTSNMLVIGISGSDYHTPYTKKKFETFRGLLE